MTPSPKLLPGNNSGLAVHESAPLGYPLYPVNMIDLQEQDSPLRMYWHILLKRRWTVIASLVIVVTLAGIINLRMTKLYSGTTRLVVNPPNDFLGFKDQGAQ